MSALRVLQVIDEIGLNSGVSSMLMNYYYQMDQTKIIFDFMVFHDISEETKKLFAQKGSRLYVLPELTAKNIMSFRINKQIKKILKEHDEYKIIHGHEPNGAFIFQKEAKRAGIPYRIIHSHNSRGADTRIKKIRNYILHKYGLKFSNIRFACSRKAAEYLYGIKGSSNVKIINNAVNIDHFKYNQSVRDEIRKQLGAQEKFIIGHVGRFCDQKNHKYLIEIFRDFNKIVPDSILLLIGKGNDEELIKRKVKEYGIEESVVFMGLSDKVSQYMQAMDAFVLPSLYEGLPVVCVEAQTSGLSCVVANTITDEVRILPDFKFLDINADPSLWVEQLRSIYNLEEELVHKNRLSAYQKVTEAGFDIVYESKKLEEYYINLAKRETTHGQ